VKLIELEEACKNMRKEGAKDEAPVYANSSKWQSYRDIGFVQFKQPENWSENEWPVVIEIKN
jgi:hypothetical protein